MLGYVTLGTSNFAAAIDFYTALTAQMGWKKLMGTDRIVFFGSSMEQAALAICTPYDEQAPTAGNGVMVAFHGGSPEGVDALYSKRLLNLAPPATESQASVSPAFSMVLM